MQYVHEFVNTLSALIFSFLMNTEVNIKLHSVKNTCIFSSTVVKSSINEEALLNDQAYELLSVSNKQCITKPKKLFTICFFFAIT